MVESIKKEEKIENSIIAQEVKIGVCKGEPKDGFVIAFNGKCIETDEIKEISAIIPIDGIPDLIQGLFGIGVNYQQETGIDIGFSDVLEEQNNE